MPQILQGRIVHFDMGGIAPVSDRWFLTEGLEERYYSEFDAIGIDEDHFHVVVGAAPRYAPSYIMSVIKSWSARLIFKKYPYIRKELWGGEFWSDGGHIDTVSEYGGLERIKKYVLEQGRDTGQLKIFFHRSLTGGVLLW